MACNKGIRIFGGANPQSNPDYKVVEIAVKENKGEVQAFKDEYGYFDFWH